MVFFQPRAYNNSDASFVPLFRLLKDFDNHYSQDVSRHNAVPPHWKPNFDVRETEQAFELHGELPGVSKEDVNIKFTDPQTMLIHGKTGRSYSSDASPAAPTEEPAALDAAGDSDKHSTSSYQVTAENDFEDVAENHQKAPKKTHKPESQDVQNIHTVREKSAPKVKYWVTERSVGEFSRSFHFPTRVEQDGTTASFKDGILTLVVPKAKKHEARRVVIN